MGIRKIFSMRDNQDNIFLTGCGMVERQLPFVACKADQMKVGQRKRLGKCNKVHKALKTAGVIYNSLVQIIMY